ncbi:MAG TPA: HAD hydrolase-like protein [Gemmataceae bacterium]|nr:HAD hydrolase-like protein [Gemmataceae bacterium]
MALTLQQYATYLDTRDLTWPAPPEIKRAKARPHLVRLSGIRAVSWSIYGTLLAISGGELLFEHPDEFIMNVALDKTIQEFKLWGAMSRKPGQPADYLALIYKNLLDEQRTLPSAGEKHPEISVERVWESFIKKLFQKDYSFDAGFYGSLNEFSRKVAYFFHASLQGTGCYPGAVDALRLVKDRGIAQALISDAQIFSVLQLERGLARQDPQAKLDDLIHPELRCLSFEERARKPSERLYRHAAAMFSQHGINPTQVLHIGSRVTHDVVPARRAGMKTGLFAGDKASLQATSEQMKDPGTRPDVLLTELTQIADVIG